MQFCVFSLRMLQFLYPFEKRMLNFGLAKPTESYTACFLNSCWGFCWWSLSDLQVAPVMPIIYSLFCKFYRKGFFLFFKLSGWFNSLRAMINSGRNTISLRKVEFKVKTIFLEFTYLASPLVNSPCTRHHASTWIHW